MRIKNVSKHIVRNKLLREAGISELPAGEIKDIPDDIAEKLLDQLPQYFEKARGRSEKVQETTDDKAMGESEGKKSFMRKKGKKNENTE